MTHSCSQPDGIAGATASRAGGVQISDNPLCATAQGLANLEGRLRKELPLFCWLNGASLPVLPPEIPQVRPHLLWMPHVSAWMCGWRLLPQRALFATSCCS